MQTITNWQGFGVGQKLVIKRSINVVFKFPIFQIVGMLTNLDPEKGVNLQSIFVSENLIYFSNFAMLAKLHITL